VVDEPESRRLRGSSDNVAPSKRNSEVRRSRVPGSRGRPSHSLEGNGPDAAAAESARAPNNQ
jgi:hypothetical protein